MRQGASSACIMTPSGWRCATDAIVQEAGATKGEDATQDRHWRRNRVAQHGLTNPIATRLSNQSLIGGAADAPSGRVLRACR